MISFFRNRDFLKNGILLSIRRTSDGCSPDYSITALKIISKNEKGENMKILIDLSSAQPQGPVKINGGGEYSFILLKELVKCSSVNDRIDIILNAQLGDNIALSRFAEDNNIQNYKYSDIEQFGSILLKNNYQQLVLPVCYPKYATLKVPDSVRIVSAVHDLCDIYYGKIKVKYGRYPKLDCFNFIRYVGDSIKSQSCYARSIENHNKIFSLNSNQVMYTVSYYSKSAFRYYLDVANVESVPVYYPPELHPNIVLSNCDSILLKYDLVKGKYFMLSACCRWAKNDSIVAFTLDGLFSNDKYKKLLAGYKVILLGADKKYKDYIMHHVKNRNKFVFDGFVSNEIIETLYKNAFMFVFPSVIEGFGMPPLEAMKYGTLVACSTAMSIPEVCGDCAIYFDPCSIESISLAILKGFDTEFSEELKIREKKRYEKIQNKRKNDLRLLVDMILKKEK